MKNGWQHLPDLLRDLILRMLRVNPMDRITSEQALRHAWFLQGRNQVLRDEGKFVQDTDLRAMAVYGRTPLLKRITLMYIAVRMDQNSCQDIQNKFDEADKDENGVISEDEFSAIV